MVVTDGREAASLVAAGHSVVLVVAEAAPAVVVGGEGPGRLAVMVGDPSDPAVMAAAREMGEELFGS